MLGKNKAYQSRVSPRVRIGGLSNFTHNWTIKKSNKRVPIVANKTPMEFFLNKIRIKENNQTQLITKNIF